jgi:hypothetical protein
LHQWAGGDPAFRGLIDAFYDRVEGDDLLRGSFPEGVGEEHRADDGAVLALSVAGLQDRGDVEPSTSAPGGRAVRPRPSDPAAAFALG